MLELILPAAWAVLMAIQLLTSLFRGQGPNCQQQSGIQNSPRFRSTSEVGDIRESGLADCWVQQAVFLTKLRWLHQWVYITRDWHSPHYHHLHLAFINSAGLTLAALPPVTMEDVLKDGPSRWYQDVRKTSEGIVVILTRQHWLSGVEKKIKMITTLVVASLLGRELRRANKPHIRRR